MVCKQASHISTETQALQNPLATPILYLRWKTIPPFLQNVGKSSFIITIPKSQLSSRGVKIVVSSMNSSIVVKSLYTFSRFCWTAILRGVAEQRSRIRSQNERTIVETARELNEACHRRIKYRIMQLKHTRPAKKKYVNSIMKSAGVDFMKLHFLVIAKEAL